VIRGRTRIVVFCIAYMLWYCMPCKGIQPWTWCYKKTFLTTSLREGSQAFIKKNIPHFTQLIFSWNADIPQKGSLQFWVRVHYADTKVWSDWHRMAEWNQQGGKTFYSKHDDGLEYCYVRLEVPKGRFADGFHIKAIAQHGANFESLKALAVSVANMQKFEGESVQNYKHMTSIVVEGVPEWSQMLIDHPRASAICSPTSLCTLASYVTGKKLHPYDFANGVFDHGLKIYGSWPCNIAYAYHATDGTVFYHVQRLHDFNTLYRYLMQGIPVVVSVRGALPGAPKTYNDGHLMTIIGYDASTRSVICHDPRIVGNVETKYSLASFLQAWENSHRLAYIASSVRD
jgi:hypothetical protein